MGYFSRVRIKSGIVLLLLMSLAAISAPLAAALPQSFPPGPIARIKPPLKNTTGRNESALLNALSSSLAEFEIRFSDMSRAGSKTVEPPPTGDTIVTYRARIPRGRPLEWIAWNISQTAAGAGYVLSDCLLDEKKQVCTFLLLSTDKKNPPVQLIAQRSENYMKDAARLALIGEIAADTTYPMIVHFLSIPEPIAVSVISGKQQTALIAQLADRYHKEIIIRLPLEPASKIPSDLGCPVIMVHYTKEMIQALFSQTLKAVPHFSGFGNFWGARALEDSRIMTLVFQEIKKNHGYFIETPTTKNSVARGLARTLGVPFEETSGTINDKIRQIDIEKQLRAYAATAQNNGVALVSITINTPAVSAIRAMLPWFKQNGITLVFPSQILTHKVDNVL